jgi:hypothetical protein
MGAPIVEASAASCRFVSCVMSAGGYGILVGSRRDSSRLYVCEIVECQPFPVEDVE